jgi:putative transposase
MIVNRVVTIALSELAPSHTTARSECARLWNRLVKIHHWCRKNRRPWPTETQLKAHFKGRFSLHSQTVQGVIERFLANVETTTSNRKNGDKRARYPHRSKRFVTPIWKPQAVKIADGFLSLSMGKGRLPIRVRLPEIPDGKIVKVELGFKELHVTLQSEIADVEQPQGVAAIDLGVIHLGFVTDGKETVAIVGRGLRSEVQRHNKTKAGLSSLRSKCAKGSRRWKKLTRAIRKSARKNRNVTRNLLHHAANSVRQFVEENQVGKLYVGDVTEMNRGKSGKTSRRLNQEVGNVPLGQFVDYLKYKLAEIGCEIEKRSEAYTSQTCPVCVNRRKVSGRVYACKSCGFVAPRDSVGSWNFLNKSVNGLIKPGAMVPNGQVKYLRPVAMRKHRDSSVVVPMTSGKLLVTTLVADGANKGSRGVKPARSVA